MLVSAPYSGVIDRQVYSLVIRHQRPPACGHPRSRTGSASLPRHSSHHAKPACLPWRSFPSTACAAIPDTWAAILIPGLPPVATLSQTATYRPGLSLDAVNLGSFPNHDRTPRRCISRRRRRQGRTQPFDVSCSFRRQPRSAVHQRVASVGSSPVTPGALRCVRDPMRSSEKRRKCNGGTG